MNEISSGIVLTKDYINYKETLIRELGIENLRFFESDDFLIEDAKKVIAEAYIAESKNKFIVIKAAKFGIEAQNSLLKIIEEPPKNIIFIIVAVSKNLLLPTIRSRLIVKNLLEKKVRISTGLNLKHLTLKEITNFIDEKSNLEKIGELNKAELKELICEIIKECFECGVHFTQNELSYINKLIVLVELNAKVHWVLTPLLLMIGDKK